MNANRIFDLSGKTIIITGGSGYLGSAMSDALAAFGANLFILGHDFKKNQLYADLLKQKYSLKICESCIFDIDDDTIIRNSFNTIKEKTGKIDVLINNAAYTTGPSALHNCSYEEWKKGIDGTINGVFRVTHQVLPHMMEQHNGNIINIASMYGMVSPNMEIYGKSGENNPANYGAGKAAIIQFTKYIACVYAMHGIRSNAISPGPFPSSEVQTDSGFINALKKKTPLNRIGKPEELQGIIVYLSSDSSSFTTGQNIAVDGGWTAW